MNSYAKPSNGYASLWPPVALGTNYAAALYAVGCRKDRLPTAAKGYAALVSSPDAPHGRPCRLKSADLILARSEAIGASDGSPVTLLRAVAMGKVVVWQKIEQISPVYTRGARRVKRDGTLAEKAFSPRVQTSLSEFTERMATTVTHDLSKEIKPLLKTTLEEWGTLQNANWADLSPAEFNSAFVEARKLLKGAVDKGYGLAAPGIQTKINLHIVDLHNKNRTLLRETHLPRFQVSFNQVDEEVLEQIGTQAGFWIRDGSGQISESMTNQGRKIVQEGVRQGVGRAVIADRLINSLPDMYGKYGTNYARVVAANVVSRARSYSEASSYQQAGIEYLEVMAMLDERTTDICRGLDGTIIPVQQSLQHSIASANVAEPEDIKTVAPFMQEKRNKKTGDLEIWIRGGPKYATVQRSGRGKVDDRGMMTKHMGSRSLARNGVTMPPYHHRCRTMTVPRVEMVQVPSNYEPRTESVPSTDDGKPPRRSKPSGPKQRPQQRPVVNRKIPTSRKPQVDGQSQSIDNARRSTRREPLSEPLNISQPAVAEDVAGYRRATRNKIKQSLGAKGVRITNAKLKSTHHGGAFVYDYKTSEGISGTWIVEVPQDQMGKIESELKKKLKKGSEQPARKSFEALVSRHTLDKSKKVSSWNSVEAWDQSLMAMIERLSDDDAFINAAALVFPGFNKNSVSDREDLTELFLLSQMDSWAISTSDTSKSLHYMQLAAVKEFGLSRKLIGSLDNTVVAQIRGLKRFDKMIKGYQHYVRAQYDTTQQFLKRKGVRSLILSKGASVRRQQDGPSNATWSGETASGTISTQPLVSYSAEPDVALSFAFGKSNAVIIRQDVPLSRIYSLYATGFGNQGELEVVVLGSDKDKCEHTTWRFASVVEV